MLALISGYSCSSPRFAKDGVFVNDVDQYFNPKQDINVWVYSNFSVYKGLKHGLRMGTLYADDKAVLKQIDFKRRGTKILFSAVPTSGQLYHLMAIQHSKRNVDLTGFDRISLDSSYYYQRDYTLAQLVIRQVYIPYGKQKGLSLIYYSNTDKQPSCPFCKIDYLSRVNTVELQQRKTHISHWKILDCASQNEVLTHLALNGALIRKHKRTFLKIYADYGASTGIQYFQILNSKSNPNLKFKLCPDKYIIELSDASQRVLQVDTLIVR